MIGAVMRRKTYMRKSNGTVAEVKTPKEQNREDKNGTPLG